MDTVIEIGYRSVVSRPGRSTRRAHFESTSEASETPEPVINAQSQAAERVPARPPKARPQSAIVARLARPPAAPKSAERKVAQQAGHGPVRPQSARAGLVRSEIERHGPARPQSARVATRPAPSAARRPQSAPRKLASKPTKAEERPHRVKIGAAEAKRLLQYLEGDGFKKAWALGLLVDEPAVTGHELEEQTPEQTPLQKVDPLGIFRGSEVRSMVRKKVVPPSAVETKDSPFARMTDDMILVQDMTAPSKRSAPKPYKVKLYSRGRGLGGLQPFSSESRVGGDPKAVTMKSVVLRTASGPFGVVTGLSP